MKTIITTEIPVITDATYDLTLPENKNKDIVVVLTTTEPIESVEVDGAKITGTNLQKETVIKTTLCAIKGRISDFQEIIDGYNEEIVTCQEEMDKLNTQLPEIQTKVNDSVKDWVPVKLPKETPVDIIK